MNSPCYNDPIIIQASRRLKHAKRGRMTQMISFADALRAWGGEDFQAVLKHQLEQLSHDQLPLQQGLRYSSQVSDEPFTAVILGSDDRPRDILVRASLFYSGVTGGCSCADDPTPLDTLTEQCTLEIRIDKTSAEARVSLVDEETE